ncbi:hypothetical protein [Plantactinospora sp. BB1]|uniref:hypothetical protein n=1 Tax=Plantactinospora sp. BB1 TaxID=2071627 RepID=UPI000D1781C1|nr:hypothetical protein [Plantactinospora sp. BB1]AVT36404.1 hypothetical protein C6W10_07860 [Plantactinospora sp. BB1]
MPVPDIEAVRRAGRAVADGAAQTAASVASGAARTARTAAYQGTRPIVNFGAGIGYFFRGAGRFLGSPALWPYAVAPLVLLPLVMLGLAHTVEAAAAAVVGWLTSFADGLRRGGAAAPTDVPGRRGGARSGRAGTGAGAVAGVGLTRPSARIAFPGGK